MTYMETEFEKFSFTRSDNKTKCGILLRHSTHILKFGWKRENGILDFPVGKSSTCINNVIM